MEKKIKKKYVSLLGLDVIEQNACDPVCNAPYASPASTLKNSSFSLLATASKHGIIAIGPFSFNYKELNL